MEDIIKYFKFNTIDNIKWLYRKEIVVKKIKKNNFLCITNITSLSINSISNKFYICNEEWNPNLKKCSYKSDCKEISKNQALCYLFANKWQRVVSNNM